tara:strand:+ start:2081 stop:2380 length:300 start_codon:yes stop_codon:yes gene_type:complete
MKLSGPQFFDINWLKGQLLTNENGDEFFIKDIQVDVANHEIVLVLDDGSGVSWNSIKDWSIQFQGKGKAKQVELWDQAQATEAANADGWLHQEYTELKS